MMEQQGFKNNVHKINVNNYYLHRENDLPISLWIANQ